MRNRLHGYRTSRIGLAIATAPVLAVGMMLVGSATPAVAATATATVAASPFSFCPGVNACSVGDAG
ncbi:MAG: hypothetical protein ACRDNZ_24245 [Streptosporangiaceae bacterium]